MPALILRALILATVFAAGWIANGWRWEARWNAQTADIATTLARASEEAREKEAAWANALETLDAARTAERRKADEEIATLRARVAAGAVRLRIAATCPTAGLPASAVGAGMDPRTGAELAPDARPDYFALRTGLTRVEAKLSACQDLLTVERDVE